MAWRLRGDFPTPVTTNFPKDKCKCTVALLRGFWASVVSAQEMLVMLKGEDQLLLAIQGGSQ